MAALSPDGSDEKNYFMSLMDDALALFDGRTKPVMAHLVESGKLTLEDLKEAEEAIRKLVQPKSSRREGRG